MLHNYIKFSLSQFVINVAIKHARVFMMVLFHFQVRLEMW